jgi:hypothetical protein
MGAPFSSNGARGMHTGFFVGKPDRKRPLGRPRRRWVDNIKIGLRDRMGRYRLD